MPIFCTEYEVGPVLYADTVEAPDWDSAQELCDNRRAHLFERVTGELVAEWEVDDPTMTRIMASLN
jgi:hypothetical protein